MDRLNSRQKIKDESPKVPPMFTNQKKVETPEGEVTTFETSTTPPKIDEMTREDLSLENLLKNGIPLDRVTLHTGNKLMLADRVIGMLGTFPDFNPTPSAPVEPTISPVEPSKTTE